jgi:hypothetical protein
MNAAVGIAIVSSVLGAGSALFSMVAMAFTMGFGTRVFFPYFAIGIALLALAVLITQRATLSREVRAFVGLCRWSVAVPLLLSFATLIVGWVPAILDGTTVHGAKEWFIILIVIIPVLVFPELRRIATRRATRANGSASDA